VRGTAGIVGGEMPVEAEALASRDALDGAHRTVADSTSASSHVTSLLPARNSASRASSIADLIIAPSCDGAFTCIANRPGSLNDIDTWSRGSPPSGATFGASGCGHRVVHVMWTARVVVERPWPTWRAHTPRPRCATGRAWRMVATWSIESSPSARAAKVVGSSALRRAGVDELLGVRRRQARLPRQPMFRRSETPLRPQLASMASTMESTSCERNTLRWPHSSAGVFATQSAAAIHPLT
jgi:hypothetical protein